MPVTVNRIIVFPPDTIPEQLRQSNQYLDRLKRSIEELAKRTDNAIQLILGNLGALEVAVDDLGTQMDAVEARLDYLEHSYAAAAFLVTPQTITDAVWTTITFDTEQWDMGGASMFTAPGTDITVPVTGFYTIDAMVSWENTTSGARGLAVAINGSRVSEIFADSGAKVQRFSSTFPLNASDDVSIQVIQTSPGASLNADIAQLIVTSVAPIL